MNISRISKAIAEVYGTQKFRDAEAVRNKDIDLFVPVNLTESVRRMAQTAAALVLRCFTGTVRVHAPKMDSQLRSLMEYEAQKMNAQGRLSFEVQEVGPWRLGLACSPDDALAVDASGWTARINGVFSEKLLAAPPAITFAVSCGVAKLFNNAIFESSRNIDEAWDFCLFRFLSGPYEPVDVDPSINLGRVGLLGAGGIGSAVGFVLRISTWSGQLDIIDFDAFQTPNLETCISSHIQDVNRPLRKALALERFFAGHTLMAKERNCRVVRGEGILAEKWNAFICAVDNPDTRLILDEVNAPVLLNAGLGATKLDPGWVLWTQHKHGSRTLSSFYQRGVTPIGELNEVPEEFREECSRKSYRGVSLALPFAALAAGSLLTASLCQYASGNQTGFTFLQMDMFKKQQRMTKW